MNKKYNPMSKEFQNECKRLGLTGNQLIQKYIEEGQLVDNDYRDATARKNGFRDYNDYHNFLRHEKGDSILLEDFEECESYIGCIIGEDIIAKPILDNIFENVDKKKFNNPGYEFLCKNPRQDFLERCPQFKLERYKEYKIDVKTAHFIEEYWKYRIDHNNIPDYFLIIGLGNRDNKAQVVLFIYKDKIIRKRQFWRRVCIKIGKHHLHEFKRFLLMIGDIDEYTKNSNNCSHEKIGCNRVYLSVGYESQKNGIRTRL